MKVNIRILRQEGSKYCIAFAFHRKRRYNYYPLYIYGQPVPILILCLDDSFISEAERNLLTIAISTGDMSGQIRDLELFGSVPYKI